MQDNWRDYYTKIFAAYLDPDQYQPKKAVGHPRVCATPAVTAQKAIDYFVNCHETGRNCTLTGLALALGYARRQTLTQTQGHDEGYREVIQRALLIIENHAEEALFDKSKMHGARFILQAGFKTWIPEEKQTIEHHNIELNIGPPLDQQGDDTTQSQTY
jgi:hypothetical protein